MASATVDVEVRSRHMGAVRVASGVMLTLGRVHLPAAIWLANRLLSIPAVQFRMPGDRRWKRSGSLGISIERSI
jgi:hypothetical protein